MANFKNIIDKSNNYFVLYRKNLKTDRDLAGSDQNSSQKAKIGIGFLRGKKFRLVYYVNFWYWSVIIGNEFHRPIPIFGT